MSGEPTDAAKFNGRIPNILAGGKVTRSTDGHVITETWDIYVAKTRMLRIIATYDARSDTRTVRVLRSKNGSFIA